MAGDLADAVKAGTTCLRWDVQADLLPGIRVEMPQYFATDRAGIETFGGVPISGKQPAGGALATLITVEEPRLSHQNGT